MQKDLRDSNIEARDNVRRSALEWLPLRLNRKTREEKIRDVLRTTPLFHGISRNDWKLLSNLFHEREYAEGEVIFERGMPGLGMYIILEGQVEIINGENDSTSVLAELKKGDFFGEMAVIEEGVRSATAVATSPAQLIGLFRPQFRELLNDRPKLGVTLYERISRILVHRLRVADERLSRMERIRLESER